MAIFEDILKEGFKGGNITSGLAVGLGVGGAGAGHRPCCGPPPRLSSSRASSLTTAGVRHFPR
jgi:hypothetical protein